MPGWLFSTVMLPESSGIKKKKLRKEQRCSVRMCVLKLVFFFNFPRISLCSDNCNTQENVAFSLGCIFLDFFLSPCTYTSVLVCRSVLSSTLEIAGVLIKRLFSAIRGTHLLPFSLVQYENNLHRLENCFSQVIHHSKYGALICFGFPSCCPG